MQAKFELTEGQRNLQELLKTFPPDSQHWNEAQNRFQFVDRILLDCLGWEHPYIEVERRDDSGGKADYILGKPVRAILEAKREAVLFDFLPTSKPGSVRKLRPLLNACKNLEQSALQVLNYCSLLGAQIAIVCNGPQLVIFQSYIPGQSPLDGECYVFNGFAAYAENFSLLWKLLSPEGVAENRAHRELTNHRNPRIPAKAFTEIGEPMKHRYRNEVQDNLRALAELLLDNVEDNPDIKDDFYRECYVPLEANNRHLLLSKNIISGRYKRVGDNGISPASLSTSVVKGKIKLADELTVEAVSARPVVVIGDVGVGKTSFFENLFSELGQEEKLKTIFIHLNLGERANSVCRHQNLFAAACSAVAQAKVQDRHRCRRLRAEIVCRRDRWV